MWGKELRGWVSGCDLENGTDRLFDYAPSFPFSTSTSILLKPNKEEILAALAEHHAITIVQE